MQALYDSLRPIPVLLANILVPLCTTILASSQESYLEKILHSFRVIAVTFTADPFHLFNLTRLAGCLDIFEVDIWILAEVHNRTQEIKQS